MLFTAAKIGARQARDGPWVIKSVLIEEKRCRRQENHGKRGKPGKKEVCSVIRIRACSEFVQVLHDANEKKNAESRWINRIQLHMITKVLQILSRLLTPFLYQPVIRVSNTAEKVFRLTKNLSYTS